MIQFAAQLRKPLLANMGNTAQFQAASSIDSDKVIALGNSRFRQLNLAVSVYLLKDANGHDMRSLAKDEQTGNIIHGTEGEYPLICRFNAIANPPKAETRSGIFGVGLFAPLGKQADEINRLGLSCYGDSLVLVVLSETGEAPIETDWAEHAQKLLESEQKAYIRKISHFESANKDLFSSAFMNLAATYDQVEKDFPYFEYLRQARKCCFSGESPCALEAVELVEIPSSLPDAKEHYLSFCKDHAQEVERQLQESESFGEIYRFAESQERRLWVKTYLERKFSPQGFQIPDSVRILDWAKENGLDFIKMGGFVKKAEKLKGKNNAG